MKIAVSSQGPQATDQFDSRFGRAAYILVYDTESDTWTSIDNSDNQQAQSGAGIAAAQKVAEAGAEVLVTGHLGPKAEQALGAAQVRTVLAQCATPLEAIEYARSEDK